jgi:aspartokinase
MSASQYEESLNLCISRDKYVIQKLKELIDEAEIHHTTCNVVKTGGTTVGAVGTGLIVVSLLAAPFTAGASLAVTAAAATCSVGGAATNIITNVVDRKKTKSIINEVREFVQYRAKIISQFQEQCGYLNKLVQSLVSNGLNDKEAMQVTFHGMLTFLDLYDNL